MSVTEAHIFAEGTRTYPGSYRGLQGVQRGSQRRKWAPFGVTYANGVSVKSFYCHHYRETAEHYHVTWNDLQRCPA